MGLMKFLLNTKKIEGTYVERYIDLAVNDKPREIYKPRKAAINGNMDFYTPKQLDFVFNHAKDLLVKFGYDHFFTGTSPEVASTFIEEFNKKNIERAIYLATESEDVVSIKLNVDHLMLRNPTEKVPKFRDYNKFAAQLVGKVTVMGDEKKEEGKKEEESDQWVVRSEE